MNSCILRGGLAALLVVVAVGALPADVEARAHDRSMAVSVAKEPTLVFVRNNNYLDMTVWAINGGRRFRLGTVGGFGERQFALPASLLNQAHDIILFVDPVGGTAGWATPPLLVNPGDVIEWRVENNLSLSSVRVV